MLFSRFSGLLAFLSCLWTGCTYFEEDRTTTQEPVSSESSSEVNSEQGNWTNSIPWLNEDDNQFHLEMGEWKSEGGFGTAKKKTIFVISTESSQRKVGFYLWDFDGDSRADLLESLDSSGNRDRLLFELDSDGIVDLAISTTE